MYITKFPKLEDGSYDWKPVDDLGKKFFETENINQKNKIIKEMMLKLYPYSNFIAREILVGKGWRIGTFNGPIKIKFNNRFDISVDDLTNEGILTVGPALKCYNPEKSSISTYIGTRMGAAMKTYIEYNQGPTKVSRWIFDKLSKNIKGLSETEATRVIIDDFGIDPKVAQHMLFTLKNKEPTNIEYAKGDKKNGKDIPYFKTLSDPSNLNEEILQKSLEKYMDEIIDELDPKSQFVIKSYYGFGGDESLTLAEIGNREGLCRERIRQIKYNALLDLRDTLNKKGIKSLEDII
jgi:RNA polymerase sigma factor (sigma-70 family)|tara:strand:- start:643 stop:1521 length:879 start_codon:yes stop_codon:yes gene_type:complete